MAMEENKTITANEQLEKLMDMALVDGILTDKEREVIMKKAQTLGIDADEAEMILEAKVYELNNKGTRNKAETKTQIQNQNVFRVNEIFSTNTVHFREYKKLVKEEYSIHKVMGFRSNKIHISDQEKNEFERRKSEIITKKFENYLMSVDFKDETEQMTMLNFLFKLCSKKDKIYEYTCPIIIDNAEKILNPINPQNFSDIMSTLDILWKLYPGKSVLPKRLDKNISSRIIKLINNVFPENESEVLEALDVLLKFLPKVAEEVDEIKSTAISKIKEVIKEAKVNFGDNECILEKIKTVTDEFSNLVELYKQAAKSEKKYKRALKRYNFLKIFCTVLYVILVAAYIYGAYFIGDWVWGDGSDAKVFGQIIRILGIIMAEAVYNLTIIIIIYGIFMLFDEPFSIDSLMPKCPEGKIIYAEKYIPLFKLEA